MRGVSMDEVAVVRNGHNAVAGLDRACLAQQASAATMQRDGATPELGAGVIGPEVARPSAPRIITPTSTHSRVAPRSALEARRRSIAGSRGGAGVGGK